jgi:hypothetical protein
MPRYFFHVCNGDGFTEDEVGTELADFDAAKAEAIRTARVIMGDELQLGQMNLASFVEIEDEAGQLLCTVTFPEAVQINT